MVVVVVVVVEEEEKRGRIGVGLGHRRGFLKSRPTTLVLRVLLSGTRSMGVTPRLVALIDWCGDQGHVTSVRIFLRVVVWRDGMVEGWWREIEQTQV